MRPLNIMAVATWGYVDIEIDRLADTQNQLQLRLLEIGVHPDFVQHERIAIQTLANLDIVARIDVPARDDPIDFREDVAVAEIELSLVEIALGDRKLGLGLLDIRRVGGQPSEGGIDVAFLLSNACPPCDVGPSSNEWMTPELSCALE